MLGEHPPDPTRGWRGIAPEGMPLKRLVLYADCSWREMPGPHGTHTHPGWPRYAAEAMVAQGVGLEVSVVTVLGLHALPTAPDDVPRWTRLTGEPDAVIVQTGNVHYYRRVSPSRPAVDRLRMDLARSLGPAIFPANRVADLWVKNVGRTVVPYPGTGELSAFLAAVPQVWSGARVAVVPPTELLVHYRGRRALERRVLAEVRAATLAGGAEPFDVSALVRPYGRAARGANRVNLNALGSRVVGSAVARWLLAADRVPA